MPMKITRRTILRYGLGGAVALAAGGTFLAMRGTVLRAPTMPLQTLSPEEFSVLAAVAERVAPGNREFPSASSLDVAERVDAFLAGSDPRMVDEVRQVLGIFESALVGFFFERGTSPFTALDAEAQDERLEAWRTSRIPLRRTVFKAITGLCKATYYATPAIYPHVGYPGPPDYGNVRRAGGAR